jgi:ligand-binding sensor domain-containing protein
MFTHQVWTREHGLPDNRVQAVRQTRDGYVWVATPAGLGRFDGRDWQVFNRANTPEMAKETFRSMAEDAEGNLWFAFHTALFRWNGSKFNRYVLRTEGEVIGPLYCSRSGDVWVGARPGLWLLRGGKKQAFPAPGA